MQLNIFGQKAPQILSLCELKAKTKSYPLHNSLGLGGANAPCTPSDYATGIKQWS
jgi:hypothetical protein